MKKTVEMKLLIIHWIKNKERDQKTGTKWGTLIGKCRSVSLWIPWGIKNQKKKKKRKRHRRERTKESRN
jgi:hypothetical protein